MPFAFARTRILELGFGALVAAGAAFIPAFSSTANEEARRVAPPTVDEPASGAPREVAIFAGGCFWGVQGVFQHVEGVSSAVSGYAGGAKETAHYNMTSEGDTGHAESVEVAFNPNKISYGKLLQIYFSVAHDPTELNRQGRDEGTQYRSAVFPMSEAQARVAKVYIAQLNAAHAFSSPVVTTVEPGKAFYPAEGYHQDFLAKNPAYPYIVVNDQPKIEALKRLFPEAYRAEPKLVGSS